MGKLTLTHNGLRARINGTGCIFRVQGDFRKNGLSVSCLNAEVGIDFKLSINLDGDLGTGNSFYIPDTKKVVTFCVQPMPGCPDNIVLQFDQDLVVNIAVSNGFEGEIRTDIEEGMNFGNIAGRRKITKNIRVTNTSGHTMFLRDTYLSLSGDGEYRSFYDGSNCLKPGETRLCKVELFIPKNQRVSLNHVSIYYTIGSNDSLPVSRTYPVKYVNEPKPVLA